MGAVSLFVYIVHKRRLSRKIIDFCLIGLVIFMVGVFSSVLINGASQLDFALSKGLYIIFYSLSAFVIMCLMKYAYKPFTVTKAFEAIVWITVIQAILSLTFFCFPDILNLYNNLVVIDDDYTEKIEELNTFRLTGIGSVQFANSAVHYGIALWIAILLYLRDDSAFYRKKWVFGCVAPLICICGILSARTFFVFLLFTVVYIWCIVGWGNVGLFLRTLIKLFFPLIIVGLCVVLYLISKNLDMIIDWALELFLNMQSGSVETSSTNDLQEMYKLPTDLKTWIIGDGMSQNQSGGFYMDSDVGYIRSIYYWGLFGSIIYYCSQFVYCKILKQSFTDSRVRKFIIFLLIWFFVYNLKEFWAIEPYWVLLLFISIFSTENVSYKYQE